MASEKELRRKLDAFMEGKTKQGAARELGISTQYLWDILNNKRSVAVPAILTKFGYKKVVSIEKK